MRKGVYASAVVAHGGDHKVRCNARSSIAPLTRSSVVASAPASTSMARLTVRQLELARPCLPWPRIASRRALVVHAAGLGSVILLAATVLSLVLANTSSSEAWLHVWETHVGPAALGLHLSVRLPSSQNEPRLRTPS